MVLYIIGTHQELRAGTVLRTFSELRSSHQYSSYGWHEPSSPDIHQFSFSNCLHTGTARHASGILQFSQLLLALFGIQPVQ